MNNLFAKLLGRSVTGLVKVACILALLGLAILSFSVVSGRPLPVVFALSFGHLAGGASFACFFLAVIIDAIRQNPTVTNESPPKSND